MFIVAWEEGRVEVSCDIKSLTPLVNLLEGKKIWFKVSDRGGPRAQFTFDFGGYTYWLPPKSAFPYRHAYEYGT